MPERDQYLYQLRATRLEMLEQPTPEEMAVLERHSAYLHGLLAAGTVVLFGRTQITDERCFGLVIFEAASEDEARGVVEGDPAVQDGVMTAELFPYRIAGMRS